MAYKRYLLALFLRAAFLFISLFALAGAILLLDFKTKLPIAIVSISPIILVVVYSFRNLYQFVVRRFVEMDDFFESVKYRDFSRWFAEESGPEDIRKLHKGFNEVNKKRSQTLMNSDLRKRSLSYFASLHSLSENRWKSKISTPSRYAQMKMSYEHEYSFCERKQSRPGWRREKETPRHTYPAGV